MVLDRFYLFLQAVLRLQMVFSSFFLVSYLNVFKQMAAKVPAVLDLAENALTEKEKNIINGVIDAFGWYGIFARTAFLLLRYATPVNKSLFSSNIA